MALIFNNHVFKGTKTLLGSKYVTYAEMELPIRYELFASSKSFDWGGIGSSSKQLAFSMLYQITKDIELSKENASAFTQDIIKSFGKKWIMSALEVQEWIENNVTKLENTPVKIIKASPKKEENQTKKEFINEDIIKTKTIIKPIKTSITTKNRTKKRGASKDNVVKRYCKELGITQKELAKILEVPEGTVSSWAVKNEIPRLGKKAIEFYIEIKKNEDIVSTYKNFVDLLQKSA
jgi:DNA-binding transcriptional regulator YiaG